tara:strand:- start:566 stop:1294 length:729 start_codon:yes stop_codon:yes gene_type:complete
MELKKQILNALGLNKDEEVKLEYQAKLLDGTIIVSTADELAAGVDIAVLTEDGTTMPLPAGKYETEDGVGFSVEEEGVVAEIYETEEEEEVVEEEAAEEEKEEYSEVLEEVETPSEVTERMPKKIKTTEEVEFNKEEVIEEIGAVIKELLTEVRNDVSRLSAELEELKSEKESELTEMREMAGNLETEKAELSSKVAELSKEPASEPVTPNKFSTSKDKKLSKQDYKELTKKEKYWYNLRNK